MTLGDVISQYRSSHGMSMERFAEISGISKAYISILERNRTPRGDEPSPSFEMYKSVAKAIGQDVNDLIRQVEGKISLEGTVPSIPPNTPQEELTPDESDVLHKYRALDYAGKLRIRSALDVEYNLRPGRAADPVPKEA